MVYQLVHMRKSLLGSVQAWFVVVCVVVMGRKRGRPGGGVWGARPGGGTRGDEKVNRNFVCKANLQLFRRRRWGRYRQAWSRT